MLSRGADALIQFVCVDQDHAVPDGLDQLTIHDGKWAFCPRGKLGAGHEWEPTGGVKLGDLAVFVRGRTARRQQDVAPPPRPGIRAPITAIRRDRT